MTNFEPELPVDRMTAMLGAIALTDGQRLAVQRASMLFDRSVREPVVGAIAAACGGTADADVQAAIAAVLGESGMLPVPVFLT